MPTAQQPTPRHKILYFSTEFPPGPGGIGTHIYQVASHLTRLGWRGPVLTLQDYATPDEIQAFNRQLPFQVTTLRHWPTAPLEAIYRLNELARTARRWRPDLILATGERAVWLTALLSTMERIPWTAVWHGYTPIANWEKRLARWAYNQANALISVSHYSLKRLHAMDVQAPLEFVIHNGADPETFFPLSASQTAVYRQRVAPTASNILLTVGNLHWRKGQDIVIRALPQIHRQIPNVHYLVVGLPTQQAILEDLVNEVGVSEFVHFLGRVEAGELMQAYNACDIFIMNSRHSRDGQYEGYGIAAVEAALCAKPAVVSDNSGLTEAIVDGVTGIVVEEDSPDETAAAVLRLLGDETLRAEMGLQARRRALQEQTWAACALEFDQVLRQILASQPPG
ncbi:glycosyltransferase family 4 protein [Chloroflexota bacterium]